MRILLQNKQKLIETDNIEINEDKIITINKNEKVIVLGEYQTYSCPITVSVLKKDFWNNDIRVTYEIGKIKAEPKDMCEHIINDLIKFFENKPNGIYKMPNVENVTLILNESEYQKQMERFKYNYKLCDISMYKEIKAEPNKL